MLKSFHDKLVEELNYKKGDVVRLNDSKLTIVTEVPKECKERQEKGVKYFTQEEKNFNEIVEQGEDIYFTDLDMVRILLFSKLTSEEPIGVEREIYVDYDKDFPIKDNILGYCSMQTQLVYKSREKYNNILNDWRIPRKVLISVLREIKNEFIKLYFLSDNNVISIRSDIKEDLEFVSHGLVFCKNKGTTELNELISRLVGFNMYGDYTIKTLGGRDIVSPSQLVEFYNDEDDAGEVLETYKIPKLYKTIDKVNSEIKISQTSDTLTIASAIIDKRRFDFAVGLEMMVKTVDYGIATKVSALQHMSLFIFLLKTLREVRQ